MRLVTVKQVSYVINYPITIHYKQDIQNKVADYLSIIPIKSPIKYQVLSTGVAKAILSPVKKQYDHE